MQHDHRQATDQRDHCALNAFIDARETATIKGAQSLSSRPFITTLLDYLQNDCVMAASSEANV